MKDNNDYRALNQNRLQNKIFVGSIIQPEEGLRKKKIKKVTWPSSIQRFNAVWSLVLDEPPFQVLDLTYKIRGIRQIPWYR